MAMPSQVQQLKAQSMKERTDKLGYIKTKNFCPQIMSKELEDTSQGENTWENISDKGLLSKIIKQLNNKEKNPV